MRRPLPSVSTAFVCLIASGLLALPALASAQSEVQDDAPDQASADAQAKRIEELEALILEYAIDIGEAEALERDAETASQGDALALWVSSTEIRFAALDIVRQIFAAVEELGEDGDEPIPYSEEIVGFLPSLSHEIHSSHAQLIQSLNSLHAQYDEASAEDKLPLARRIRREEETVDRFLAEGAEQIPRLEAFGLDAEPDRVWLGEKAAAWARLMAGRITLLGIRDADLEASGADPATIQVEQSELNTRLDHARSSLESSVELLEGLEINASRYKPILVSSSDEITTDILDLEVAQSLLSQWMSNIGESIAENAPRIALRIVIFALLLGMFWLLSRFVRRVTERAVEAPHLRFSELLKRMIVSLASGFVMLLGVLVAVSQLGLEIGPMVAGLGIAGFIVGFALQETLGNFAAGVMILAYRPFDVGDIVECASGAVYGTVSHMSLVSTTILTFDNKTRVVPNGKIWGDVITNVTAQKVRRVDLVFGIAYSDDIPHAEEVLQSIVKEHPKVVSDPEPVVRLHELGDSSVNFIVRPWATRDDYWDVYWDITREVKMRFDREDISIPFPQRDVHLHGGASDVSAPAAGGEPSTMSAPVAGRGPSDSQPL